MFGPMKRVKWWVFPFYIAPITRETTENGLIRSWYNFRRWALGLIRALVAAAEVLMAEGSSVHKRCRSLGARGGYRPRLLVGARVVRAVHLQALFA